MPQAASTKIPESQMEMDSLSRELNELHNTVDLLVTRLSSVSRSEIEKSVSSTNAPLTPLSPLANSIRELRFSLVSAKNKLSNSISLLEI